MNRSTLEEEEEKTTTRGGGGEGSSVRRAFGGERKPIPEEAPAGGARPAALSLWGNAGI